MIVGNKMNLWRLTEVCASATPWYGALPHLLCLYLPGCSLSIHLSVYLSCTSSVHHQLFTLSKWIFQRVNGLSSSIPHPLVPVCFISSVIFLFASATFSLSRFPSSCLCICSCGFCQRWGGCPHAGHHLWAVWYRRVLPSSPVPGFFGRINGRSVSSDSLLGLWTSTPVSSTLTMNGIYLSHVFIDGLRMSADSLCSHRGFHFRLSPSFEG